MKDWRFLFEKFILRRHHYTFPEPEVKKKFETLRGQIFIDIGSNTGIYAKLARGHFNRTVSIDPNPKYNSEIQAAISDRTGWADLFIGDDNGAADSLIRNPHILGVDWTNGSRVLRVKTFTFDDLNIDADLVKIDVEGAELLVIDGMERHLPKRVIIEIHDEKREAELVEKMCEKGYSPSRIDINHWFFQWKHRGSRLD